MYWCLFHCFGLYFTESFIRSVPSIYLVSLLKLDYKKPMTSAMFSPWLVSLAFYLFIFILVQRESGLFRWLLGECWTLVFKIIFLLALVFTCWGNELHVGEAYVEGMEGSLWPTACEDLNPATTLWMWLEEQPPLVKLSNETTAPPAILTSAL